MADRIVLSKTARKSLKDKFGVTAATVTNAANFRWEGLVGRRMRSYAVNFLRCPYVIDKRKVLDK